MTLGALNLLSVTRVPMAEADVIVARAFADLPPPWSIVQHRASAGAQRLNEQLSGALTSRVVIEQAKGVISERVGVDLAEAFFRCGPTPAAATSPHRCRPGRHRRHPRSAGLGGRLRPTLCPPSMASSPGRVARFRGDRVRPPRWRGSRPVRLIIRSSADGGGADRRMDVIGRRSQRTSVTISATRFARSSSIPRATTSSGVPCCRCWRPSAQPRSSTAARLP